MSLFFKCEATVTEKRGSRFLLYCHVPQLVLALLLLLRRLDAGFTNDLDPVKVALHGSAALAHRCLDIEFRKHPKSVGCIGFTWIYWCFEAFGHSAFDNFDVK